MTLFDRPNMRAEVKPVSNAALLISGTKEVFPEPVVPLTINAEDSPWKNAFSLFSYRAEVALSAPLSLGSAARVFPE